MTHEQAAYRRHPLDAEAPTVGGHPQTELRDRIRRAVCEAEGFAWDSDMLEPDEYGEVADAVLAVLPPPAELARAQAEAHQYRTALQGVARRAAVSVGQPTRADAIRDQLLDALDFSYCQGLGYSRPEELVAAFEAGLASKTGPKADSKATSRAAVLREAADVAARFNSDCQNCAVELEVATELRRLAAETQQQPEARVGEPGDAVQRALTVLRVWRDERQIGPEAARLLYEVGAALTDESAEAQQQPDTEAPFVTRVLDLFARADSHGELLWRIVDGQPEFAANVSDVFAWGGADAEDITPDTLPVLEQAFADLKAVDAEHFTADLYAARLRKMRPQGAAYPDSKTKNWREVSALYDACGPERALGLGNPKAAPAHQGAAVEGSAAADTGEEAEA